MTKEGLQYDGRREGLPVSTPLEQQVVDETMPLKLTFAPYENGVHKQKPDVTPKRLPETGDFAAEREGLRGLHRYYNGTNR